MLQYGNKDSLKLQQENLLNISKRLRDLTDVYCPKEAAAVHYKGDKDQSKVAQGKSADLQPSQKSGTLMNPFHYRCL